MKRPLQSAGGALLLSMLVILVFAGIVTAGHLLSSSQILMTSRSADMDSMQVTGEGLLDYGFASWRAAMMANSGPLTKKQATDLLAASQRPALPPWITVDSLEVLPMDDQARLLTTDASLPTKVATLSEEPKGWQANSYLYSARVKLSSTTMGKKKTTALECIYRHDLVPPVGGLFYTEGDFELYKPAPMIIGGNVHTNANAYVTTHATTATDKLRFLTTSNISFAGGYQHAAPPKAELWSAVGSSSDIQPPIYDRGYASQVSKADKLEGIGMGTSAEFNTTDSNPNNDGNHELIEPPTAGFADPPGIASSRIYNNAGLIVEISGPITGTASATQASTGVFTGNNVKITAKNGTALTATKATSIIATLQNTEQVTTTEQQYVYNSSTRKYEWKTVTVTNTVQKHVYDKREAKEVLVSDVNLGTLNTTLNTLTGFNNIMYINNTASTTEPKAVRLDNAGVLPNNGLTVATEGGLYVMGDYNTGTTTDPTVVPSNVGGNPDGTSQSYKTGYTTKPAALVADAVMFLSNNWADTNDAKALSSRAASHTTINAAVIAGYIPSGWVNPATNETYWYSGGANNFPRFLENWGSKGMTFNGAFVQLFKSQMFTGEWNTGDIYSPPNRRWSFDRLLLERVIPGIPPASAFSRGRVRSIQL